MPLPALDLVVRLTATVGTAHTLTDVYDAALNGLRDGFGVDRASILLFDADDVMRFKAWRGLSSSYRDAVEGHTPWTRGQAAPEPVMIPDAAADPSLAAFRDILAREQIGALLFVPLVAQRGVIGKFTLYRAAPGPFADDDVAMARAVGFLLGFAVERTGREVDARRMEAENRRLLDEEATLRERLTTLTDGSRALLTAVSRSTVVSEVLALAARVVPADGYAVWRRHQQTWRVVGSRGLSSTFADARLSASRYLFDRPIIATDLDRTDILSERMKAYAAEGIISLLSVPLTIRDEASGSIVFYHRSRHQPTDAELRVAAALGHLSAAAISNVELYEEQQQLRARAEMSRARAAFLAHASERLASLDYHGTLGTLAQLAVPELADWCAVDLRNDRGGLTRIATAHMDPARVAYAEEIERRYPSDLSHPRGAGQVLRTGRPELYADISEDVLVRSAVDDEHLRMLRELQIRSAMVVPLAAGDRVFGVITFVNGNASRPFDEDDLAFATELGRRAAFAIENARLYQEARNANRVKDEFLATLSHELRTPLNVIRGRARMLLDTADVDRARQLAQAIDRNAETLGRLVDDLLDASRMTAGQLRLQVQPVQVSAVVDAAVQAVQAAVQAKGLRLVLDLPPDLPQLHGDATRLQQIFWNLLTNAVKFTPAGGTIEIGGRSEHGHIELWVRDSGQGIADAALPRLFDMFWQAEPSSSRAHGGLGLGLSVVRKLVELHGGEVRAESDGPGRGATFRIVLPGSGAAASA